MLLFFTFGLPLTVSGLLFAKRKSLYNPKVHAMMGFLYARFQNGSEFWEIHEVVRKCALMGLVRFFLVLLKLDAVPRLTLLWLSTDVFPLLSFLTS